MTTSEPSSNGLRRKLLLGLVVIFVIAGVAYSAYWLITMRFIEATEDAYVGGHIVAVSPQVAGTVVSVGADDTDQVKAGQVLVRLDDADAKVAIEQAETQLARIVRQVRNLFTAVAEQQAMVELRRSDLARAADDLQSRERLGRTGNVAELDVRHARETARGAQASRTAAQQQLAASRTLIEGTDLAHHPDVLNAASHVRESYLALARTVITAPVAGTIARRSVQVGARVNPGSALMSVVPLEEVWVDANFKEVQLASMRVGQPVELSADLYGDKVVYHGKIKGFGAGTGSAFALLPAQNATGNWIKVVQRVPVRVAIAPADLAAHPLQIGLSMTVAVDTKDQNGARLPRESAAPTVTTVTFDDFSEMADARIAEIIAANMGAAPARP